MAVLLDSLGYREGDVRILEAMALVAPKMEVEAFAFDGEKSVHYHFKPAGTELVFENGVLEMVMARKQPNSQEETYGLYPRPAALVDGLPLPLSGSLSIPR